MKAGKDKNELMSDLLKIVFSETAADIGAIHNALYSYNLTRTGEARVEVYAQMFPEAAALVVRNAEGEFKGGLAYHWENAPRRIFVDYFFLDESLRGQGMGRKVFEELFKLAEAGHAVEINLTTNTFQAPGFYAKLGFKITGQHSLPHPMCPENIHYTFKKILAQ